jgi:hypothetical protein
MVKALLLDFFSCAHHAGILPHGLAQEQLMEETRHDALPRPEREYRSFHTYVRVGFN